MDGTDEIGATKKIATVPTRVYLGGPGTGATFRPGHQGPAQSPMGEKFAIGVHQAAT